MQGMNIKSVARLSGVTEHTLRAWEKRHQVIQPERSEGGQRLYSMADVRKLKLLAFLVERGHAIRTMAKLSVEELSSLVRQSSEATSPPESDKHLRECTPTQNRLHAHHENLLAALRLLDLDELDRLLLKARMDTPARVFALEVVSPLLAAVGNLVVQDKLDIAQEHALSAILRNHLGDLVTQVQKANPRSVAKQSDLPGFLFATPEGDLHEFGILLAAILTGSKGLSFRYLGPNMPAESLAKATVTIGAKIVVLGSVEASADRLTYPMKEYVRLLSAQFRKSSYQNVSIWIGGYCDFEISSKISLDAFRHVDSLMKFDSELDLIISQARLAAASTQRI